MRIIAFIEDEEVIEKILKRLVLLEVRGRSPAQGEGTIRNDLPLPVWSKDNDAVKAITEEDLAELHVTKDQ